MSLVWMFDAHRTAVARVAEVEREVAVLVERNLHLQEELERATSAIEAMQTHIASNPAHLTGMMDVFNKYQEHVLQETPYVDGKIPDDVWLTGESVPFEVNDGNA